VRATTQARPFYYEIQPALGASEVVEVKVEHVVVKVTPGRAQTEEVYLTDQQLKLIACVDTKAWLCLTCKCGQPISKSSLVSAFVCWKQEELRLQCACMMPERCTLN